MVEAGLNFNNEAKDANAVIVIDLPKHLHRIGGIEILRSSSKGVCMKESSGGRVEAAGC
jgi:hypothetical protein